jgi:hypothetical protein
MEATCAVGKWPNRLAEAGPATNGSSELVAALRRARRSSACAAGASLQFRVMNRAAITPWARPLF